MIRRVSFINKLNNIDILLILFYLFFVCLSLSTLYSINYDQSEQWLDFSTKHSKQLYWVCINLVIIVIIISANKKIILFSIEIAYIISILSLLGLIFWGKKISGATSWYGIMGIYVQPTEFVKITAILLLSKYIIKPNYIKNNINRIMIFFLVIILPIIMILIQPDPGSALVFLAFVIIFYKNNILTKWINISFLFFIVSILSLFLSKTIIVSSIVILALVSYLLFRAKIKAKTIFYYMAIIISMVYVFDFFFDNILEDRHRNRINVLINNKEDIRGAAYNINQSLITIASGKLTGKGYMKGEQTRGHFLPEQSTDFIFCNIAEDWGFMGATIFIILYLMFLIRILYVSDMQNSNFNKIFGYSIVCVLFFQFFINVAMTLGIFPVIGIPLPFISYGGSSLTAFTILLFMFIKFDYEMTNEW